MPEFWDVYDKDRRKTGKIQERGKPAPEGASRLIVHIWLMFEKEELLLTRRHPQKPWGGLWECTGGSVLAGEDSLHGAIREVREEVGIILDPAAGTLLESGRTEDAFVDEWFFRVKNPVLVLQESEVIDAVFAGREQYDEMIRKGLLVPVIPYFYDLISKK